jgi:hypothetical protein
MPTVGRTSVSGAGASAPLIDSQYRHVRSTLDVSGRSALDAAGVARPVDESPVDRSGVRDRASPAVAWHGLTSPAQPQGTPGAYAICRVSLCHAAKLWTRVSVRTAMSPATTPRREFWFLNRAFIRIPGAGGAAGPHNGRRTLFHVKRHADTHHVRPRAPPSPGLRTRHPRRRAAPEARPSAGNAPMASRFT